MATSSCSSHCPDAQNTQAFSYAYDRYGNRWKQTVTAGSGGNSSLTFSGGNNRMDGYSYDAAGNLLYDGTHSYTYDAEGRIMEVDGGQTAISYYDAEGRRVRWQTPALGGDGDYFYDTAGRYIGIMNNVTGGFHSAEVYAGAMHLGTYTSQFNFSHGDQLGTIHAWSTAGGALERTCTGLPFGDDENCTGTFASTLYYTGKEDDYAYNLDYLGARYYAPSMGRFMTPDPLFISPDRLVDPQSLNLYGYVRGNPVSLTDPTGLDFYLLCQSADHSGCGQEQNGSSTVWVQGTTSNGHFTPDRIANDDNGNLVDINHGNAAYSGTFDRSGVHFSAANGSASGTGQFIDNSNYTIVNGSGLFKAIQGVFVSDCGGSCQGRAELRGTSRALAAMEGALNRQDGLMSAIDLLSGAHSAGTQWKDSNGYIHVILNGQGTLNACITEMHFEGHPTHVDVTQWVLHIVGTIRDAVSGRAAAERNRRLP